MKEFNSQRHSKIVNLLTVVLGSVFYICILLLYYSRIALGKGPKTKPQLKMMRAERTLN